MKNFLTKYFGILGYVIYLPIAVIIRIPVGIFLWIYVTLILLIISPITRREYNIRCINHLYDWYIGE